MSTSRYIVELRFVYRGGDADVETIYRSTRTKPGNKIERVLHLSLVKVLYMEINMYTLGEDIAQTG